LLEDCVLEFDNDGGHVVATCAIAKRVGRQTVVEQLKIKREREKKIWVSKQMQ
jgi:hypothetical protein